MTDHLSAQPALAALALAAAATDKPVAHLAPLVLTPQTEVSGMYTVEVQLGNGSYEWNGYADGVADAMYRSING